MFRIGLQTVSPLLSKPSHLLSSSSSSSISNASRRGPSFTFLPSPTTSSSHLHLFPPSLRHFHTSIPALKAPSSHPSHPSFVSSPSSPSFTSSGFHRPRPQPSPSSSPLLPPQRRFLSSEDGPPLPKGTKAEVVYRQRGSGVRFIVPKKKQEIPFNGSFRDLKEGYERLPWSYRPIVILFIANLSSFLTLCVINFLDMSFAESKMALDELEAYRVNQVWLSNMLVSWKGLTEYRVWTLLLSGVCHDHASKIIIDLVVMQIAGPLVLISMGSYLPFAALVATSSIVGNLTAAAVMNGKGEPEARIPGGQAPVAGVVTYLALNSGRNTAVTAGSLVFRPYVLPVFLLSSSLSLDYNFKNDFVNGQTSAQWGGVLGGVLFFVVKKALRL